MRNLIGIYYAKNALDIEYLDFLFSCCFLYFLVMMIIRSNWMSLDVMTRMITSVMGTNTATISRYSENHTFLISYYNTHILSIQQYLHIYIFSSGSDHSFSNPKDKP